MSKGYLCKDCGFEHPRSQIFSRHICPNCKKQTFIISIFGSICESCLFDPAKDVLAAASPSIKEHKTHG